jgi:hypothetical protein
MSVARPCCGTAEGTARNEKVSEGTRRGLEAACVLHTRSAPSERTCCAKSSRFSFSA